MKRSLMAILLVVTMLFGCVCSVNAAMTKDEFITLCKALATEIEVPVDIMGMKTAGTYGNSIVTKVNDGASFKAVIKMENVKNVVSSVLDEAETALGTGSSQLAAFQTLPVVGEFEITATWTGVTAPADILDRIVPGFDGLGDIFEVTEKELTAENAVRAKIAVKQGIVVTKLAELPEEISLEIDGFTVIEDGQMDATIAGSTSIVNSLTNSYDVVYKFKDAEEKTDAIKPVIIDVRASSSSGGGAATTTFYTLKYETNGGTEYKSESHKDGKKVELTKVPEKEGYAFGGWYSDAELKNKITSIVMDSDKTVYAAWVAEGEPGGDIAHPVPDILNGEDHIAYIHGYPDGTVRPTANITRAEVAAIFFRLLKDEVREANLTDANAFADVNDGDWFNTPVSTMAKLGVVNGKSADTFAPNAYITRAEFATICARFDEANESAENIFSDIDSHWAEKYILETVAYKWIAGYEDGTFRPDSNITRAETATLINRVLVRLPEDESALLEGMKVWPDNPENAWYYLAIQEATNSHTYGRVDALNEKWNTLTENRDWLVYED